jgi:flagellar biosynthetic protein FliQ
MSADYALELVLQLIRVAMLVTSPILLACLSAGLIIGVVQTATQLNEPSLAYLAKVLAVTVALAALGSRMGSETLGYMRRSFAQVAEVTK